MPVEFNSALDDMLRELGNIGCSHALTALSRLTSTDFVIRVPDIEFLEYRAMPSRLGEPEEEMVSVLLEVSGELNGVFLLLLKPEIAARLLEALSVEAPRSFDELSLRQRSALLELGNIMGSSYLTAVSQMTGLESKLSIPSFAADMLGAILNQPIVRFAQKDSRILYIQNIFTIDGRDWAGSTLLLPELESAKRLGERLGAML